MCANKHRALKYREQMASQTYEKTHLRLYDDIKCLVENHQLVINTLNRVIVIGS